MCANLVLYWKNSGLLEFVCSRLNATPESSPHYGLIRFRLYSVNLAFNFTSILATKFNNAIISSDLFVVYPSRIQIQGKLESTSIELVEEILI